MIVPVVAAIIQFGRSYGEVLLKKRGMCECGYELKDKYEFPGGKVKEGETLEEALIREIKEELDVDIEGLESKWKPRLVHSQINKYDHSENYYLILYYECFLTESYKLPYDCILATLDAINGDWVLPGTIEALKKV